MTTVRLLVTLTLLSCAEARDPSQEQAAEQGSPIALPAASATPVATEGRDTLEHHAGTNARIIGADNVIRSMRGQFRQCYQAELNADPEMQGKVVVEAKIAPGGNVESTNIASNTGLSPAVVTCIADAIQQAHFEPPGGSGGHLNIPITFRKVN
jgi:TonB family protein